MWHTVDVFLINRINSEFLFKRFIGGYAINLYFVYHVKPSVFAAVECDLMAPTWPILCCRVIAQLHRNKCKHVQKEQYQGKTCQQPNITLWGTTNWYPTLCILSRHVQVIENITFIFGIAIIFCMLHGRYIFLWFFDWMLACIWQFVMLPNKNGAHTIGLINKSMFCLYFKNFD